MLSPIQIDPDRSLFEQCRNLPYDLDWEFPEERLILGENIGAGAFGSVIKAKAIGMQVFKPRDKTPEAIQLRSRLRRTSVKKRKKKKRCNSITLAELTVAVKTLKGKTCFLIIQRICKRERGGLSVIHSFIRDRSLLM